MNKIQRAKKIQLFLEGYDYTCVDGVCEYKV